MPDQTPRSLHDEFLSAPDQLLKNKEELAKARKRKAREEARTSQLATSKLDDAPSVEDMLADIVRIADDKELNPWWEFRSMSRRRYELYGAYHMKWIDAEFGQFNHALEVAGLRDQAGTRLWKAKRARESRRQHAERHLKRYVQPYVDVATCARTLTSAYRLLSLSDAHGMMLCPFVWLSFLSAIRDLKPDGVLLNGDIIDAVAISRHPKIPGWTPDLQDEFDFQGEMYRQIREIHDGDLFSAGGNHDLVDRLALYLTQSAKELIGIRSMRIDKLMELDQYDVKLFHGGSILSPDGTEEAKHGYLMFGFYRIHHGVLLGQTPALSELRAAGRSGQSGHAHRSQLVFGTTERDEGLSWMSTPMAARHEVGRAYVKGVTGWQRGFGYAELFPDGTVHQYPVVVQPGERERVCIEGFRYERPDDLKDPDPSTIWLPDVTLGPCSNH
jgi:hypothetical protein